MDSKDTQELMREMNASIQLLASQMDTVKTETKEMLEVFRALQGLFTVVMFIGKIAKPIAWVVGVIAALSLYFQGVKVPKLPT